MAPTTRCVRTTPACKTSALKPYFGPSPSSRRDARLARPTVAPTPSKLLSRPDNSRADERRKGNALRGWAWVFLALVCIEFVVRGPARAVWWSDDLAPPYGAARAWLHGTDPYDHDNVGRVLMSAGRLGDMNGRPAFGPSLYPPSTFVVMAPLAMLSWSTAKGVFLVLCLVLFVWHLRALLRLGRFTANETGGLWLLGSVVALAPFHTGIAVAQLAIPSATLLVLAIDRLEGGGEFAGGALLGVATLFKPQLAGPFILYFFLRRQPRAAALALGICFAAAIAGIAWLQINDINWLDSWRAATASVMTAGSEHDPAGPWSAQLLELRPLITALTGIGGSGTIGFAVAAALGIAIYARGRHLSERDDLLLLAAVAVLTLFATYHRFYDAAVLSLVLAWSVSTIVRDSQLRKHGYAAAICCAVFFVPGAWMMQRLVNDGTVPPAWAGSFLWNAVLIRHQNWALVALFIVIWLAVQRARRRPAGALASGAESMVPPASRYVTIS